MEPKVNQTWKTKSGNTVLIVKDYSLESHYKGVLKLLWFDPQGKEFLASEISGRLDTLLSETPDVFLANAYIETGNFNQPDKKFLNDVFAVKSGEGESGPASE